jgi:hypothetical protein
MCRDLIINAGAGMKLVHVWVRAIGGSAVLALALSGATGCTGSTATGDAGPAQSASAGMGSVAGSSPATTDVPSASASPVLPDGRSPAYLTGLDTTGKTVTFDLIQFLTGDAAKAEWTKEHPGNTDGPPNDYLIVNNNKLLRTLPVAADAQCVVLSTLGGTDTKTISFADFPAFLKQQNAGVTVPPPDLAVLPFWLTVQHGTVVKFEEQFLP